MIYLLRHTKPHIESGICYGQSDLELDPCTKDKDIAQAIDSISHLSFSAIYSSPLKRCLYLAKEICRARENITLVVDSRVIETNFGSWEMQSWDDIHASDQGKEWFANYLENRAPGGESFNDMIERADSFFDSIKDKGNTLVVTHDGFIRASLVSQGKLKEIDAFNEKYPYGVLKTI